MTSRLFDFSDPQSVARWSPINDTVMGGVSRSELRYHAEGFALFAGHVSVENNGGFASVRSEPFNLGREHVLAYQLEVRGDGKHYKFTLRTDNSFDGVNYQARFHPPPGSWTSCRIGLAEFVPSWRGRLVPNAPLLDTNRVRQIGLMIADQQAGDFALAVRSIAVEAP